MDENYFLNIMNTLLSNYTTQSFKKITLLPLYVHNGTEMVRKWRKNGQKLKFISLYAHWWYLKINYYHFY